MEEVTENLPWKPVVNFLKEVLTGGAVIEQFSGCQPVTGEVEVGVDLKIMYYLKFTFFFFFHLQAHYCLHYSILFTYTNDIAMLCLWYNSSRI